MPDKNIESLLSAALSKVKYRHPDLTKRDVLSLLHHYRGLIPKQDKFIFNDGVQRDLINIYGTIPVPYKGQNYNIPISLWLLDTHPYHAPLCFVKPTPDMQIKVSNHVDHSGKIYLPYLHDWARPNSELLGLIQICIVTFSEQPPVYSKPKDSQATTATSYPTQAASYYPQQGQIPMQYAGAGFTPQYAAGATTAYAAGQYAQGNPASYPSSYPVAYQQPKEISSLGQESSRQAAASVAAQVDEKVRAKLREECAARQADTDALRQLGEELVQGQGRLQQMVERLGQETKEVDEHVQLLTTKETELTEAIERLEAEGEVDCDEAVAGTAPLFRQLLNASAEESATEDAIYFLGEALRRGVIDCEVFLKHVRQLSRRQFILRATMHKARRTAGLKV